MTDKKTRRKRRHKRIRAKISGTKERPRLSIYRSLKHIYAQLIDDENGKTLKAVSDLDIEKPKKEVKVGEKKLNGKVAAAYKVGKEIGKRAKKDKIKKVVADRGGYKYHGRVKALIEGARDGGLKI
ncbi:MAG: 50S ribosomal protein L18 [Minisyncoccales bacterium]